MSVDVEEHFHVSAFEGLISREQWEHSPSRVVGNTTRLLDLFEQLGVSATFFVLGWVAEREPGLVRSIVERGHELACHGYSHRLIHTQRPEAFREELTRAKGLLEQISGTAIQGHRAASFSIGRKNLWALDIVAECGFGYDSSLFPVIHDRYGIPGAPRGIYRVRTPGGYELVEVPPSTVALGPWNLPVIGGGYLRLYPRLVSTWALGRLNRKEKMAAVIYVHPWEIDPDQPRIQGLGRLRALRHYANLGTTLPKLRLLARLAPFTTMGNVIRQAGALQSVELA